jgi:hypothetical protein
MAMRCYDRNPRVGWMVFRAREAANVPRILLCSRERRRFTLILRNAFVETRPALVFC